MASQGQVKQSKSGGSKKKIEAAFAAIKASEIPYQKVIASCVCGAEFEVGSTVDTIRVDICSNCHPFFTGEKRIVDAEGRVEKFRKKYNLESK